MDAFVTREPSIGPMRPSSSSSTNAPGSSSSSNTNTNRLPRTSAIPSFYGAAKKSSSSNNDKNQKNPYRLKQTVIDITRSLKASDNPITHSNAYSSAFHYVSCSSGHQNSHGFSRESVKNHNVSRTAKLKSQGEEAQTAIFKGVRAYINGSTTPWIGNLELIKLIQRNGGEVRYAFSKRGCTHIICTQNLSASKTHREMSTRSNTKVVTPKWVLDSIVEGKKLAESKYSTLKSETQARIYNVLDRPAGEEDYPKNSARTSRSQSLPPSLRMSFSEERASLPPLTTTTREVCELPEEDDDGDEADKGILIISSSQ